MRLSAKPLKNYANINNFDVTTEWNVRDQDVSTLYFQLVDLDKDSLRYMPTDNIYSIEVTFPALNPVNNVVKVAAQVSALDRSIWKVEILDTDKLSSGNVQFAVTEGSIVKKFSVLQMLNVEKLNNGGC